MQQDSREHVNCKVSKFAWGEEYTSAVEKVREECDKQEKKEFQPSD